jgi:hypothetical protein
MPPAREIPLAPRRCAFPASPSTDPPLARRAGSEQSPLIEVAGLRELCTRPSHQRTPYPRRLAYVSVPPLPRAGSAPGRNGKGSSELGACVEYRARRYAAGFCPLRLELLRCRRVSRARRVEQRQGTDADTSRCRWGGREPEHAEDRALRLPPRYREPRRVGPGPVQHPRNPEGLARGRADALRLRPRDSPGAGAHRGRGRPDPLREVP